MTLQVNRNEHVDVLPNGPAPVTQRLELERLYRYRANASRSISLRPGALAAAAASDDAKGAPG
ncbi:MAG: hypothetical protein ACREXN_00850 [Polaromonas sp.]